MKKLNLYSVCFTFIAFVLFVCSMFLNQNYFEQLAYMSVFVYQFKQAAALFVLWGIGFFFLMLIRKNLGTNWCVLLAFPTGCCLWVFVSFAILLAGIPYSFFLTMIILLLIDIILFFVFQFKKDLFAIGIGNFLPEFCFVIGFLFLASTGLIYVFVSYDSYFYFTNYGNTLTIVKNFKDIVGSNSFTLTNISQFLPLLNSYTSFWGLDQCFQVQAMLTANIGLCFYSILYRYATEKLHFTVKKSILTSSLLTLFLFSSTSFIIASTWILANMYCMAFLFFIVILWADHFTNCEFEVTILTAFYYAALTLLRKDGIIFVCFFMICIALQKKQRVKKQLTVFLPSVVIELYWLFYVRVILKATVTQAAFTSIANNKNIAFVIAAIFATIIYLVLFHPLFQKKLPFPETFILYGGMLLILILLTIRDWNQVVDNIDMTIRNMAAYPSSWGISAVLFGFFFVLTLLAGPLLSDQEHFIWIGYIILNFISYCAANKYLWVNWDDSYNRIVLQIIPVFIFLGGKRLLVLLQSDTPD